MPAIVALLAACTPSMRTTADTTTIPPMHSRDWHALFDGTSTRGWRNVGQATLDPRWQAIGGALVLTGGGGGDIVTDQVFADFELEIEWQVARGGNSGIFYRAGDVEPIWTSAPEMQVLDDAHAEDRHVPSHRAGSVYDLYAPTAAVARPAGEFNQARIVARGSKVEHWLNGVLIVRYDLDSADWQRRVAASKFAGIPMFAASRRGHIGLQDHGDPVRFRNIRIRAAPRPAMP